MAIPRLTGFVVGHDTNGAGKQVWKVRVKDTRSVYDGQKFIVASVHDDIELVRGLNVNFVLGVLDGPGCSQVQRAIDVSPEQAQSSPTA